MIERAHDKIRADLMDYIILTASQDHYKPEWFELIAYCAGYYNEVTVDMIMVVRDLQREGIIQ